MSDILFGTVSIEFDSCSSLAVLIHLVSHMSNSESSFNLSFHGTWFLTSSTKTLGMMEKPS